MIKIEAAHIEEVRGIRNLDIVFGQATYAISGPNGSGKSGVIDAIEFCLTGQIGRLMGPGTKGLTIADHGPHVDKTKFPDAAFVTLNVHIPSLKKSATITRKLSAPRKPKIVPSDADIKAVFAEIEDHPEVTLSRREILRFILAEPTKRSEEIQTILKLDEIGQTRAALNTAQNRLQTQHKTAQAQASQSRDTLLRHLQIAALQPAELLDAANKRRNLLGLTAITSLTADTVLDVGIGDAGKVSDFNKQSALRDIKALSSAIEGISDAGKPAVSEILAGLAKLEADPTLLDALNRRSLVEKGLELVDGPDCPLCDQSWEDEAHLRAHLQAKLAKSAEAAALQLALIKSGAEARTEVISLAGLLGSAAKVAQARADELARLLFETWVKDLDDLKAQLSSFEGLLGLKPRLTSGWAAMPAKAKSRVGSLLAAVEAIPDQSAAVDAQTFLSTAQLRLTDYREAMRRNKAAEAAGVAAKTAYDAYCAAMETQLNALYDDVQEDFSTFYRMINEGDEVKFTAKLTPSEGKLDFAVNFYERGLFPPAAFHSEGHQDGMGVCLYLALMKRLFGDRFTIALLDDVVMSVDAGHRYQFCQLLKTHFPNTQFIITTHDRLWAEQMRSAGLVTAKTSLAFHSWTVDTGPLVESNEEIWQEIAASLAKGKVEAAAAALRHHLEYASRRLADNLGARPVFKSDGNYELGELLPSVLARLRELCGKSAEAAQSWKNDSAKEAAVSLKAKLSTCNGATNVEQWAVNKAVHYNEWANFGRKDFEPVVAAFKELLDCFRCAGCGAWLYATPRGIPDAVRCSCTTINFNLKAKEK
ncbi:AAA family ATPase [Bradyrhizobium sp. ma5]|uniref:ATP-binding protein n=1 Tax=Bradyrhizobium sp. ma5 TaxID=3344828 RepID=UPI0035D3E4EE